MDFLKEALKNPKDTGAFAASSKQLAELVVREARLADAHVITELGPGTGAFTRHILAAKPANAAYLGIEINGAFVAKLRAEHPDASFHAGSAEEIARFLQLEGHAQCDRVISGIPWSFVAKAEREAIMRNVVAAMAPGGIFVTFAYFPLNHFPLGREVRKTLGRHFKNVTRSGVVMGNLPPAFVYVCAA